MLVAIIKIELIRNRTYDNSINLDHSQYISKYTKQVDTDASEIIPQEKLHILCM